METLCIKTPTIEHPVKPTIENVGYIKIDLRQKQLKVNTEELQLRIDKMTELLLQNLIK